MKISIIVPLFDRRNAGWKALESALAQRYPRDRYEVVAVTARDEIGMRDPAVGAMLARCDAVAHTDLDPATTTSEVELYRAGHRRCTGDLVFFCEGHTVLHEDACLLIDEHFARTPGCDIAWAPRLNHAVSPLGRLVAMHNDRHQQRALAAGVFSLGANSVIRRGMLDALGGLDARYLRFSETALFHRALQRRVLIGRIRAPLATHYNDMGKKLWLQLAQDSGAGRYAYYEDVLAQGKGRGRPDQAPGLRACETGGDRRRARPSSARVGCDSAWRSGARTAPRRHGSLIAATSWRSDARIWPATAGPARSRRRGAARDGMQRASASQALPRRPMPQPPVVSSRSIPETIWPALAGPMRLVSACAKSGRKSRRSRRFSARCRRIIIR